MDSKDIVSKLELEIYNFLNTNYELYSGYGYKCPKIILDIYSKSEILCDIYYIFSKVIEGDFLIPTDMIKQILEFRLEDILKSLEFHEMVIEELIKVITYLMKGIRIMDIKGVGIIRMHLRRIFYHMLLITHINKHIFAFEVHGEPFPDYMKESLDYYKKYIMYLAIGLSTGLIVNLMRAIPGRVRGMVGFYELGSELCNQKWNESSDYYKECVNLINLDKKN